MNVYVIAGVTLDALPFVSGVFSTKEKAEAYLESISIKEKDNYDLEIYEEKIDSPFNEEIIYDSSK